jgi:hypothetical protein
MGSNNGELIGDTPPQWVAGDFDGGLHLTYCINPDNTGTNHCGSIMLPYGMMKQIYNYGGDYTLEMYLNWDYQTASLTPGDIGLGYIFSDGGAMFVRSFIDTSTNPYRCALDFGVQTYTAWRDTYTPTAYSLQAGQWTHVAFVCHSTLYVTKLSIYVNGALAVTQTWNEGGYPANTGYTEIGATNAGELSWGGSIDEIRLSNVARTTFGILGCGDWGYMPGDLNQDCHVDFKDLAIFAQNWLN